MFSSPLQKCNWKPAAVLDLGCRQIWWTVRHHMEAQFISWNHIYFSNRQSCAAAGELKQDTKGRLLTQLFNIYWAISATAVWTVPEIQHGKIWGNAFALVFLLLSRMPLCNILFILNQSMNLWAGAARKKLWRLRYRCYGEAILETVSGCSCSSLTSRINCL